MKKLLGIMAVVAVMAVMAAPAMAAKVDVKLTTVTYIELCCVPGDFLVTLAPGQTTDCGGNLAANVLANVATRIGVSIAKTGTAQGTWAASVTPELPGTPGNKGFVVNVTITGVDPYAPPAAGVKEAELTITASLAS